MNFTKMQGIGNDYIYVNCFEEYVPHPEELAVRLSDRHVGIGSDGLILIRPSEQADAMMDLYNADGSRAMMCGNGIRCVGKYLYEKGIVKKDCLQIETLSGIKELHLNTANGCVKSIQVDMGKPGLDAAELPVLPPEGASAQDLPLEVDGVLYHGVCVSMGNPHTVLFVENPAAAPVERVGRAIENHPWFPQKTNVEFIRVISPDELEMRVWERGSGETMACGTGACASAVAAALTGRAQRSVLVHLLGGDLRIDWALDGTVYMEGGAEFVFDGSIII